MKSKPDRQLHASNRIWIVAGCVLAAIGVSFGAIGAHLLEKLLTPKQQELWDTGVQYQMYMAFGLLVLGLCGEVPRSKLVGILMLAGALLFSGCLYAYALTDVKPLVHIVPIGGFAMIAAWLILAWSVFGSRNKACLLYTSPSPRDATLSRMPSSA